MAERFLPLYLIALGGGALSVGFLNGLDNFLSALYSFPGGWLAEKLGYKKSLMVFTFIAMIGYSIVVLIPTWQAVIFGSFFFISWTAISLPAIMSLVSQTVPKNKRVMGVTIHSLVRRIPMALGPVLGGWIMGVFGTELGVRIAFASALALGTLSLALQHYLIRDTMLERKKPPKLKGMLANISGDLRILLVSDILIRFAEQIPYAFVVIWVVNVHQLTAFQFGILTVVEMVTAMLIYIPIAYLADKHAKKPYVVITFGFFSVFPLLLIFTRTFEGFVIAFIIRGLKEFGEPTRKSLIMDFAPEGQKAGTFGMYYLIRDVIVSVAAFGGAFLWSVSPQLNLIVACIFGGIGTLFFWRFGKNPKPEVG